MTTSAAAPRAPLPLRALRYAGRRVLESALMARGALIQAAYAAHYWDARRSYPGSAFGALSDVGVRVIRPGASAPAIRVPSGFDNLVATVARSAAAALDSSAGCEFYPPVAGEDVAERSSDVGAVRRGEVLTIKLRDPFALDGVRELCDPLLDEIERRFYGSYAIADKVYVYRSPISRQAPSLSWLWHFDNHPREMLKVMVYLTDVTGETAPFEYLRARATGRPMYGSPLSPMFGEGRIEAAAIDRLLADGWEREAVTGPRGTVLVFDDNVVHRATTASAAHRDVIVFQARPVPFAAKSHIHRRWSGTFKHRDFQRNPWELFPFPRPAQRPPEASPR